MTVTVDHSARGSRSAHSDAPDLVSGYQDHLARKVATGRESREIYAQLLGRVASGELDPKALDRELNSFVQVNGPAYASRIADLSMRFLVGLVDAGTRDLSELLDELAPGTSSPITDPPALDPAEWADWIPRLIDYAEQARVAQTRALRILLDRVASGDLDPEVVERTIVGRGRQQVSASVTRIAELSVEMLNGLDDANAAFGTDYLRSVARRAERPESIEIGGRLGEAVQVRLLVANDEPVSEAMRCAITDVRREDGVGPAFEPEVTITPSSFDLAPGGELAVSCSLVLSDVYAPDVTYVGEFLVLTDTATVLAIPLRVRATEHPIAS